jgi:hypothetical protein
MDPYIARKVLGALIFIAILAVYGIVGEMDKRDEIRFRAEYCAMVREHALPGHKRVEAESCADLGERVASP